MAAPTIDGHNHSGPSGGTSQSISLTTTLANDIIVIAVTLENNSSTVRTVTGITGGGLTFAKRSGFSQVVSGAQSVNVEVWWAFSAAIQTATSFTVNISGTNDDWIILAFGVNGCNATNPWDSNVSLPASQAAAFSTAGDLVISTTNANDLLLAVLGGNGCTATANPPTGFSTVESIGNAGGANCANGHAASKGVTATQSSVHVIWGASYPFNNNYIVDAMTADAPPATMPPGNNMTGGFTNPRGGFVDG